MIDPNSHKVIEIFEAFAAGCPNSIGSADGSIYSRLSGAAYAVAMRSAQQCSRIHTVLDQTLAT
jgi:hypothetical protein